MIKMALNEYKEMKKRGQVSFFMILGILLLIIVGFVIYLTSFTTKEKIKKEVITTQKLPTEIQEINNYVVSCLDRVTQDGLELIGKRGGMIIKLEGGIYNPSVEGRDYLVDSGGEKINYAITNIVVSPFIDLQGVNILPGLDIGSTGNIHENLEGYILSSLLDDSQGGAGSPSG